MKTYNAINAGVPNGHINLHYSTKEWTEETEKLLGQCTQYPQMDHFIIYKKKFHQFTAKVKFPPSLIDYLSLRLQLFLLHRWVGGLPAVH